eukprot:GDKI01040523.1.p2 GENE.GDKI01040523.1~~GDKI01040523.1.p2  ORF type:complete len:120 (-),score=30.03 GDKI01040523.1:27-386(-)
MYSRLGGRANFLMVYVREAHACDVWPVGDGLGIKEPKTNAERCEVAARMLKETDMAWPTAVDTTANLFEEEFACWPYRFYVLGRDGRLLFKGMPDVNDCAYPIDKFQEAIRTHADAARN